MSGPKIMVFIELSDGKVSDVSLELITKAKELSSSFDGEVLGCVMGYELKQDLSFLGKYGCDRVYKIEHEVLKQYTTYPYSKALISLIEDIKPEIVLFGATLIGRDLAPRVASALGCGLTADCTDLKIDDFNFKGKTYTNQLLQIRPAWGGNILATIVSPEVSPSMATVRKGVFLKRKISDKACEVIEIKPNLSSEDVLTEIIHVEKVPKEVDLSSAKIVVGVGMGASDERSFALVKELAEVLGAQIGATRPVVDSGLLSKEHQIGQTGVTVRPNLYIACGISGQIQHRAGILGAKRIIAINKDPKAPIFEIAHYRIVGDVNEVIPKMIKVYKQKLWEV